MYRWIKRNYYWLRLQLDGRQFQSLRATGENRMELRIESENFTYIDVGYQLKKEIYYVPLD